MLASTVILVWMSSAGMVPSCPTGHTSPTLEVVLHTSIDGGILRLARPDGTTFECRVPAALGVPNLSIELEPSFTLFAYEGVLEVQYRNHDKAQLPVAAGRAVVVKAPFPIPTEVMVFVALIVLFAAFMLTQMWRSSLTSRLACSALLIAVFWWAATATRVLYVGHTHCGGSVFPLLMPLVVLIAIAIYMRSERAPARALGVMAWILSLALAPCGGWLPMRQSELERAQESLYANFFLASTVLGFCFLALPWRFKDASLRRSTGLVLALYFCVIVATALLEAHYRSYMADSCGG